MTGNAVMVFEPEHGGHQPAYVRLLAEWVSVQGAARRVVFAVSARLLDRLQREDAFDLRRQAGCDVLEIAPAAASWLTPRSGPLLQWLTTGLALAVFTVSLWPTWRKLRQDLPAGLKGLA